MSTIIDVQTDVPPGFPPVDFPTIDYDCISQNTDNNELNFIYNVEYDYGSDQSVYSESIIQTKGSYGMKRKSLLSKKGQIRIRREVPLKLRETLGLKYVQIPVYETSLTPNHRIRNAITGLYTPHRVGSYAESLYFKVCWAVGIDGRREPINLFFETPYEYEKHFMEVLSDDVKMDWVNRYRVVEKAYRVARQEQKPQTITFIH